MNELFKDMREGNKESLVQWLQGGGDVDCVRKGNKETLIMHAAMEGYSELVEILINAGADLSAQNSRGHLPVTYAAKSGDYKTVRLFLDRGYGVNDDISGDGSKETFLLWAAYKGSLKLVVYLLEQGANVNAKCSTGSTALVGAATHGHIEVFKTLQQAGADIFVVNQRDNTALIRAAYNGHTKICKLLVEAGIELDAINDNDDSALTNAAKEGHEETCIYLMDAGAQPMGNTLIEAIEEKLETLINRILADKPDLVHYRGWLGMTPLTVAAEYATVSMVKRLLGAGANIDEQDDDKGWTALMHASYREDEGLIDFLKQAGANEDIKDKSGKTAFDLTDDFYDYDED